MADDIGKTGGRSYGGPNKYIQRAGEVTRLGEHIAQLGSKAFLLADPFVLDHYGSILKQTMETSGLTFQIERFNGECSSGEIDRITGLVKASGATVVVGIGGGKTADTAKMAAIAIGARIVIVPTIASTDAPCSAVAVRYTDDGVYREAHSLGRNPDMVIVDSAVIVKAPVRFLVSGIGDALSTWFEARSNLDSNSNNLVRPNMLPPAAGIAIARACHDVLMRDA